MKYLAPTFSFLIFLVPIVRWLLPEAALSWYDLPAVVGLALAYVIRDLHARYHVPYMCKEEANDRQPLLNQFLLGSRERITAAINQRRKTPLKVTDIRVNVMLITKGRNPFQRSWLRIYYHTGQYSDSERETKWYKQKVGSGTCGAAWNNGEPTLFDGSDSRFSAPKGRLNSSQNAVTEIRNRGSVLSIQIKAKGKPKIIGVLNVDSKLNMHETFFDDVDVISTALTEVRKIVIALPTAPIRA